MRCCFTSGAYADEQMKDEDEPVQVKIVDFNRAGVITRVEVHRGLSCACALYSGDMDLQFEEVFERHVE